MTLFKQFKVKLLFVLSVAMALPASVNAIDKIDDTHYRQCIMDCDVILSHGFIDDCDNDLIKNSELLKYPHTTDVYNGIFAANGKKLLTHEENVSGVYAYASQLYSGNQPSVKFTWWSRNYESSNTLYKREAKIFIEVVAPTGVSVKKIPSRMLGNETSIFECKLDGDYPDFYSYGGGFFEFEFLSSDENIITFESKTLKDKYHNTLKPKIISKKSGKTTITVKAYARNENYNGSYYIGKATAEIEVVDNLDPTDISLSSQDFSLDIGQEKTISATLTPDDARTEITWSSSDNSVVTVDEGVVKAVGRGNAFVEATTSNGLSAKCYVTVLGDEDYHNVCIDGLYYDLDRKKNTAAIVHENPDQNNSYISGAVAIPEKVQFYGVDYTVTKIDVGAFFNCEITSVKLPETIKVIEFWAFSQTLLEEIELPQGLIEIGKEAFRLTNLESIIIGPNVAKIGEGAFANCRNLKAVYVDEGNPHYVIYNSCLYNAAKTKLYYVPIGQPEVDFPEGLETIGANALESNKAVTSVKFPETLIDIDNHAFYGCVSIEKLSFPNSLLEIGSYAFDGCDNLEEINFGSKLKIIGKSAFFTWKKNLKVVRISALNPPTADDSFHGCYGATLVVPLGRVSTYKKDSVWGKFAKITDDEDALSSVDGNMWGDDSNGNKFDVYSLQGILLRQDLTKDEINNLPSGLYLVNGEKFIVK